ncbi:putative generative cell specific-1/HAP2 domain-containing protein [Helianthus debilis subsp. tardiflorus]
MFFFIANLLSLWEAASGTFILWKLLKGEHCPLPPFSWRLQEVVIGPNNRTATSHDNFLRVNLVGDFAGYNNIPSFEDFFLVIPRQGGRKIWEGTFLCGCYLNE